MQICLVKYVRREDDYQRSDETANMEVVDKATTPLDIAATSVVVDDDDDDGSDGTNSDQPRMKELLHSPTLQQTQTYQDVVVNNELNDEQKDELQRLLKKYSDTFTDVPGVTKAGHHDIEVSDSRPIHCRPYPLPHALRETVKKEVQEMLDYGVIEPSSSPYASPVVIVAKKDGTNRLCCDFRKLNLVTVKDVEPIPDQDEIFAKIANDYYFTKIDLTKGYWPVTVDRSS